MRDFWRDQLSSPRWVGAPLAGSPDMYASHAPRYSLRRQPTATINFVTCHDGFTLNDLVSYDSKRNEPNKEGNKDGDDDNRSWNCGSGRAEDGPSNDPGILTLRRRHQRNFLATLLISRGVPMLLAGGERNRTQQGNNNAYCQDNTTSWLDWTADPSADNLTTVVRNLISLRARYRRSGAPVFPNPVRPGKRTSTRYRSGVVQPDGSAATSKDWDNTGGHSFAVILPGTPPAPSALIMLNTHWNLFPFTVPDPPSGSWTMKVDTTRKTVCSRQ